MRSRAAAGGRPLYARPVETTPLDGSTPTERPGVATRPGLDAVPAYVPGRSPVGEAYKLSSNENPYPPLPSVLAVVQDAASELNRYPDMFSTDLAVALAERHDVPVGRVVVGTGSSGVLAQLMLATCGDGDEVVFAWRSFESYPIASRIVGATPVAVPLTADHRHDLDAMARAITDRTRVVLVCTPNNPTGPAVGAAELEAFLQRVPPHVLVVLDEAYREFVTDADAVDALAVHGGRPNVAVLRTFSKAYGLAGLRVGYAVAHEPLAAALRKTAVPFGVSAVAQRAALASLHAEPELLTRVGHLVAERERVRAALAGQGWELPASQANFLWFPLGERSGEFAAACEEAGIVVRAYGDDGVRATIGENAANDRLIAVAGAWRSEN